MSKIFATGKATNSAVIPDTDRIRKVCLIRHGERIDHVSGASNGEWKGLDLARQDSAMTPVGLQQAEEIGKRLKKKLIAGSLINPTLFSSPFFRCMQTAQLIAENMNVPVYCEWGFGEKLSAKKFTDRPKVICKHKSSAIFSRVDANYRSLWRRQNLRPGGNSMHT